MTPEEEALVRADERGRILYLAQRHVRIMFHVAEMPRFKEKETDSERSAQQGALDLVGWLANQVHDINKARHHEHEHYEHIVPASRTEPRPVEPFWKIEWQ